jgi:hypothetical protein
MRLSLFIGFGFIIREKRDLNKQAPKAFFGLDACYLKYKTYFTRIS